VAAAAGGVLHNDALKPVSRRQADRQAGRKAKSSGGSDELRYANGVWALEDGAETDVAAGKASSSAPAGTSHRSENSRWPATAWFSLAYMALVGSATDTPGLIPVACSLASGATRAGSGGGRFWWRSRRLRKWGFKPIVAGQ
jgi:hypothetical protein